MLIISVRSFLSKLKQNIQSKSLKTHYKFTCKYHDNILVSIQNEPSDKVFIVRCNIVEAGAHCSLCGTYEILQALQSGIPMTILEETIQQYLRGTVSLCHGKPGPFSLKEPTM